MGNPRSYQPTSGLVYAAVNKRDPVLDKVTMRLDIYTLHIHHGTCFPCQHPHPTHICTQRERGTERKGVNGHRRPKMISSYGVPETRDKRTVLSSIQLWAPGSIQLTWIFENTSLSHKLFRRTMPFFTSLNLLMRARFNKNFFKGVLASFCTWGRGGGGNKTMC